VPTRSERGPDFLAGLAPSARGDGLADHVCGGDWVRFRESATSAAAHMIGETIATGGRSQNPLEIPGPRSLAGGTAPDSNRRTVMVIGGIAVTAQACSEMTTDIDAVNRATGTNFRTDLSIFFGVSARTGLATRQ